MVSSTLLKERNCRVCDSALETILSLGELHPSGFLRPDEAPLPTVPHDLCVCTQCRLVQLRHTINPDLMFRKYWYLSGINEVMREELADIVKRAAHMVTLKTDDVVVDIGANDGTLLAYYPKSIVKVAFEPARNLYAALRAHANVVISDYFPEGLRDMPELRGGKAKIVTSIACFYDLDEPGRFVAEIKKILHPEGVWVVQFQDWDQMQQATAFDNICTEHLVYYSLASFQRLIEPYGLRVVNADLRRINGGSYRIYVCHAESDRLISPNVATLLEQEQSCEEWATFHRFAWRCEEAKKQIQAAVDRSGTVDLYGASTKANTLLQWCELDARFIRQAWERSLDKIGLRTPGTDIPIVSEAAGRKGTPDALLAGIWQFRAAMILREEKYLKAGGTMIFPLPHVDVVTYGR